MQLPHFIAVAASGLSGPGNIDGLTHAGVVVIVVGCATALRFAHALDPGTVGNIYAAAIGYAAGRSGGTRGIRASDLDGPDNDRTPA